MTRTVYVNGRVFTADEPAWAEAIVTDDGRIAFVGSDAEAIAVAGSDAAVVDLGGRVVVPGFIDAHTHLVMMGEALGKVGLTDARTLPEIQERLRAARDADPDAPRLLGRGWLFDSVPGGAPTAAMLDAVVADVPVYLDANDYHSVWVNAAALRELGIDRQHPDPIGGRSDATPTASPTACSTRPPRSSTCGPISPRSPPTPTATPPSNARSPPTSRRASRASSTWRSTSSASRRSTVRPSAAAARCRSGCSRTGSSRTRATTSQNLAQVARAVGLAGERRPWLKVAGIKLVLDGVIDACTAAMRHPYADGSNAEPIWPLDALKPVVAAADAAGLQVAMHAIGDLASDVALDALEHAHAVNGERPRRHRIEHLEYAAPETAGRMAALGVTASMQPVHADPAIWANWAAMLGDERADRGFAWTEFRRGGCAPGVLDGCPDRTARGAAEPVHRGDPPSALDGSYPANHPEYAVPLADAVAHATRDAAASCLEEHERGRIAPGLAADFAVLDRDPFTEGADVLLEARVVRTVVAGHPVYEASRSTRRYQPARRPVGSLPAYAHAHAHALTQARIPCQMLRGDSGSVSTQLRPIGSSGSVSFRGSLMSCRGSSSSAPGVERNSHEESDGNAGGVALARPWPRLAGRAGRP